MASTSVGSSTAFAFGLLSISLLVLLLLRHYLPLRSTPAYLLLPVFLALALPASIILLVPIDLASSATDEAGVPRGIWLPQRALLVCWRISYWLTFVLTWFILPVLGEYADSGHREPRERILYSLRRNAKYQLVVLGSSIAGLVYFFITSGVEVQSLKAMVMALAYAWGLVLSIYLMGHGLVAVPRKLFRNASISGRLRRLQSNAPRIHERLAESLEDLAVLEAQVLQLRQRKTGTARNFQDWIEDLVDSSDMPESRIALAPASRISDGAVPVVVTERYMADLTRKLKRARHKRIRFVEEWDRCVKEAKHLQDIMDSAGSKKLHVESTSNMPWYQKSTFMTPYMRYQLNANIIPGLRLLLSGIFALASLCVAWSEVFSRLVPKLSVIGLSIVHHPNSDDGQIGFAGQVISGFWLLYMMTAALTSVSEVKVWGNRALVTRHTYAESACWYASLVARLTVPLSFNFTTFVPDRIFKNTAFFQFLGRLIDLTPLGKGFSQFFPIFILVPICATAFNLYGKVKVMAGYGGFEDDEEDNPNGFGTGGWREGKALIDRELNSANSLGLANRDRSPQPPGSSANALATTPSTILPQYRDDPSSFSGTSAAGTVRRSSTRPEPLPAEEEDDGNFFSDFAHRVRNTFETTDKPDWVRNFEFKKPKWMGGDNETSGRAESGKGLGRWFGGRPDDGRVRL